ncbi:MAG: hypothetical protein ACRDTD_12070 [Pseudonocardiaceae bacterium]
MNSTVRTSLLGRNVRGVEFTGLTHGSGLRWWRLGRTGSPSYPTFRSQPEYQLGRHLGSSSVGEIRT